MRVTEKSRLNVLLLAQNRGAERVDRAARAATSGKKVLRPSDDPAAYGSMLRRDFSLAMLETHEQNATRTQGEFEVAQNALSNATDLFVRAKELAVEGANTTGNAQSRKLQADEVYELRDQLLAIANTRYGSKYLFGGTRTDVEPFDPTTFFFQGNAQSIAVPVLEGVAPTGNVSGARAFTVAGGRDVFADLTSLAQALAANDIPAIRAALTPLERAHDQLVASQVEAGFGANRFKTALEIITTTKTAITEQLSKEIEGDPVKQLSELTIAKQAYEKSVAVTKQILAIAARTGT